MCFKDLRIGDAGLMILVLSIFLLFLYDIHPKNIEASRTFFVTFSAFLMGAVINIWASVLINSKKKYKSKIVTIVSKGSTGLIAYLFLIFMLFYISVYTTILNSWDIFRFILVVAVIVIGFVYFVLRIFWVPDD